MNKPEQIPNELAATDGIVVASCSVADLFSGKEIKASDGSRIQGRLHLPEYQRPYRWGYDELKRLLRDLRTYFAPTDSGAIPKHDFFLGSVILHQERRGGHLNIIDGQQRITTLGLLAWLMQRGSEPVLSYQSPISQRQIRKNVLWLKNQDIPDIDLKRINIVLVVTRSEDDAYRFFETQNTGGVRLSGPDIIKAHHLRATPQGEQDDYARKWEKLGKLDELVDHLLKGRYWQVLDFRELPSRLQKNHLKLVTVDELAERTGDGDEDISYQQAVFAMPTKKLKSTPDRGYAMRQPLNAGINAIHYLHHFQSLHNSLLISQRVDGNEDFYAFYNELLSKLDGCAYLKELYDSAILAYVSHFGYQRFYAFSLWLFRVVYSRRVSNKKAVREKTIGAFVRDTPVYDWIFSSFTPEACLERFQAFSFEVNEENIGDNNNSVKMRFINKVNNWFELGLTTDNIAKEYDQRLVKAIMEKASGENGHVG